MNMVDNKLFNDHSMVVGSARFVDPATHPSVSGLVERLERAKIALNQAQNSEISTNPRERYEREFLITTWTEEYRRVKDELSQEMRTPREVFHMESRVSEELPTGAADQAVFLNNLFPEATQTPNNNELGDFVVVHNNREEYDIDLADEASFIGKLFQYVIASIAALFASIFS